MASILYLALPENHITSIHQGITSTFASASRLSSLGILEHPSSTSSYDINECRAGLINVDKIYTNENYELLFNRNIHIVLKLITRQQIQYGDISFDSVENLAYKLKALASYFIYEKDIKLIYSKSYPQFAFEFCIMLAAQSLDIKFIFDGFVPYFNRTILQEGRIISGSFEILALKARNPAHIHNNIERPSLLYIHNVLQSIITINTNSRLAPADDTYTPFQHYLRSASEASLLDIVLESLKEFGSLLCSRNLVLRVKTLVKFRIKNGKNKYLVTRVSLIDALFKKPLVSFMKSRAILHDIQDSTAKDLDLKNIDVVYFASQEPEASILVNGGSYNTNYSAICYLRAYFEESLQIGYKEHMSSFLPNKSSGVGTEPENINCLIYSYIKKLSNVHILDRYPKSLLFAFPKTYATICGSIGFEASLLGQNVLLFSGTWYSECNHPNIHSIGNWKYKNLPVDCLTSKEIWANFLYTYLEYSVPCEVEDCFIRINRDTPLYLNNMLNQLTFIFT